MCPNDNENEYLNDLNENKQKIDESNDDKSDNDELNDYELNDYDDELNDDESIDKEELSESEKAGADAAIKVIKKKNVGFKILIAVLCVIVVLMLSTILVFSGIFKPSPNKNSIYTTYSKDGELYVFDSLSKQSYLVDDKYTGSVSDIILDDSNDWIYYTISDDTATGTYYLCRRALSAIINSNDAATKNSEKIDNSVVSYQVTNNGTVYYTKLSQDTSSDKTKYYDLYEKNENASNKLDSGVIDFNYSDNKKTLIYYCQQDKKNVIKEVDKNGDQQLMVKSFTSNGVYIQSDNSKVYYIEKQKNNNVLYCFTIGSKKTEELKTFDSDLFDTTELCYVSGNDVYYSEDNVLYCYNSTNASTQKISNDAYQSGSNWTYIDSENSYKYITAQTDESSESSQVLDDTGNTGTDTIDNGEVGNEEVGNEEVMGAEDVPKGDMAETSSSLSADNLNNSYFDSGKNGLFVFMSFDDNNNYSYTIIKDNKVYKLDKNGKSNDCYEELYYDEYNKSYYIGVENNTAMNIEKLSFNDSNNTFSTVETSAKNVSDFSFSTDGAIMFINAKGELNMFSNYKDFINDGNSKKIGDNVVWAECFNNYIVYSNGKNELYYYENGKSSKISGNVTDWL